MPHTLLLADDSVTIQRVIELTFAEEDVKVVAVSDGDQAIERLESAPPDIVLADIGMPGKNGYEVARYVKQTPKLSHIPVVLLTGAFEPVDQSRAAEAGCDGVLAKPFEPQLVIGRVKELLAGPRRVTASTEGPSKGGHDNEPQLAPAAAQTVSNDWTAALPGESFAPVSAQARSDGAIEDYFDRLDAAFATRSGGAETPEPKTPAPAAAAVDWFGGQPGAAAPAADTWDVGAPPTPPAAPEPPLSYVSPQGAGDAAAVPAPASATTAPSQATAASLPVAPATPPQKPATLPPLADAFAALLAAEEHEPLSAAAPAWPASSQSVDDLVEQITRRVLERVSDSVVREAVTEIVASTAERLIREEIERIKASIK